MQRAYFSFQLDMHAARAFVRFNVGAKINLLIFFFRILQSKYKLLCQSWKHKKLIRLKLFCAMIDLAVLDNAKYYFARKVKIELSTVLVYRTVLSRNLVNLYKKPFRSGLLPFSDWQH